MVGLKLRGRVCISIQSEKRIGPPGLVLFADELSSPAASLGHSVSVLVGLEVLNPSGEGFFVGALEEDSGLIVSVLEFSGVRSPTGGGFFGGMVDDIFGDRRTVYS
jgi:hypothetical protein